MSGKVRTLEIETGDEAVAQEELTPRAMWKKTVVGFKRYGAKITEIKQK